MEIKDKLKAAEVLTDYLRRAGNNSQLSGKRLKWVGQDVSLKLTDFFLYHIQEITFEKDYPQKEAMENILGSFRGMDGISFLYLLLGDKDNVSFYLGVARDLYSSRKEKAQFTPAELGKGMLKPNIEGNFRGCQIKKVEKEEKARILNILQGRPGKDGGKQAWWIPQYFGLLEGVPGVDEEAENFQGAERLVDVMLGSRFGLAVIARPYTDEEVATVADQLCEISDVLTPLTSYSLQQSTGSNSSASEQVGSGQECSSQTTIAKTCVQSKDIRYDTGNQQQCSYSESDGGQNSYSHSFDNGTNTNDGKKSERISDGISKQKSHSFNEGTSGCCTVNDSESVQGQRQSLENSANSRSSSYHKNYNRGSEFSSSKNEQLQVERKLASDWLKYIDEVLFPRLDNGRGKGIFQTCTFLFTEDRMSLHRLGNTLKSLYSGAKGNKSALSFRELKNDKENKDMTGDNGCIHALQDLQIPTALQDRTKDTWAAALSRLEDDGEVCCGSWLSADELGLLAGLPQKEVIGLKLREEVEFGLNTESVKEEDCITLGNLVQSGAEKSIPVSLSKSSLNMHTFITGVTGSGKTTTCKKILIDCGLPFLVVEPAKTEYRSLLRRDDCSDVIVFTPGKQGAAPFFLNPFELFPGEAINSRADMLKATLEASFEMEAAMPQIMETAIYRAYKDKGWDIWSSRWYEGTGNDCREGDPYVAGANAFPTLAEYKTAVNKVVEEQGFDVRLKNDYLGSLNARIDSLLFGAKGMMLNV